jgi:hypothetical protein
VENKWDRYDVMLFFTVAAGASVDHQSNKYITENMLRAVRLNIFCPIPHSSLKP